MHSASNISFLKPRVILLAAAVILLFDLGIGEVIAQPATSPAKSSAAEQGSDGSVRITDMTVPLSSYLSPEAKAAFIGKTAFSLREDKNFPENAPLEQARGSFERVYKLFADRLQTQYPVTIKPETIGGISTQVVEPKGGVTEQNRNRVLVNVHGGGFWLGWPSGALTESIPIAGTTGMRVITVDYRMAPEHKFPAATEDLAAVYRELLKSYPAKNIGIYGCSAGGALTAHAAPWFNKVGLPQPGALGVFGSSASGRSGDSPVLATALAASGQPIKIPYRTYMTEVKPNDPLAYPATDPKMLALFPPTLILNSTRDPSFSGALDTHVRLLKAGAKSELYVGEGLWHCYIFDDIPEARDAYHYIARFFDANLGREAKKQ